LTCRNSDGEEEIASSVRIFCKSLTLPEDTIIEAGGIGEVCTSSKHQRRGLSKILLLDALQIMKQLDVNCSFLHASLTFRPVYAKVGYECVSSPWSVVSIALDALSNETNGPYECTCTGETVSWKIRHASFPGDTSQLLKLHQSYSEHRCITIQRSERYWNEYLSQELDETLWVLTKNSDASEQIIGWMAIRSRGGRYQLRDFGYDRGDDFSLAAAVKYLLGVTLNQAGERVGEGGGNVSLHLPSIVLSDLKDAGGDLSFLDMKNAMEENDDGWMYVNFDDSEPNVLQVTQHAKDGKVDHLIWPADSF
jgi:hypothetical protein